MTPRLNKQRKLKDFSDGKQSVRTITMILSVVCGILLWWGVSNLKGVGSIIAGPQDIIKNALPELMDSGESGDKHRKNEAAVSLRLSIGIGKDMCLS